MMDLLILTLKLTGRRPGTDPDAAKVENEQENENENDLDEGENDEDPSPDGDLEDQEIELQPAHRAELLNVLASIELKFALLNGFMSRRWKLWPGRKQ